jgi:hypothetical protein
LKILFVDFDLKVIQEEDISNLDIKRKIFSSVAPKINMKGFSLAVINNFEFLSEVPIVLIPENV